MVRSKVAVEEEIEKRAVRFKTDEKQDQPIPEQSVPKTKKPASKNAGRRFLSLSKLYSEGHEPRSKLTLDPDGRIVLIWNRIFLLSCLASLCIDPLFFFLHFVDTNPSLCIRMDQNLRMLLTYFRSILDLFYTVHIVVKFHIAYVDPSSMVLGKGELVMDHKKIARRYIRSDFFVDLMGALPFLQILVWFVMPAISFNRINTPYLLIILIQCTIRFYIIIPLSKQIINVAGFIAKTAWGGAIYNLLLYLLASHVVGSIYYFLMVERQATCWQSQCLMETGSPNTTSCGFKFLNCEYASSTEAQIWANTTNVFTNCDASNKTIPFNYGIFLLGLQFGAATASLSEKYFYSLWWGFQQLSTYGNPLVTSAFVGENLFAIGLTTLSLGLFAQLLGSMLIYLRSISENLEEWRLKQRDTEEWMKDHQLPDSIQDRVSRFIHYKWLATRGVEEESMLKALPADLRRDIQHHLCMELVRRVPFFSEMDDQLLDAICERMVSFLRTEGTYIIREGDPVTEMLFIIRGKLESSTTDGGRANFFNSIILKPGDFCGEELLTWALLPTTEFKYLLSTRTVRTLVEVEAFALRAEDLKFVANQFRKLHSKRLQHTFRFYSHHWRTWAACFIQAAWRRHRRKQMEAKDQESPWAPFFSLVNEQVTIEARQEDEGRSPSSLSEGAALPVTVIASIFRKAHPQKPDEPDFSAEDHS
uniref:Cyclic nucleotide-binding domain-containing protein n=1 Tax=Ananas comosus var. bracteatus TaxID=296719 RepID=A0A6V7NX86_ANACO|nr:unnamed protein product [Ananas comosus var. bracteatus]